MGILFSNFGSSTLAAPITGTSVLLPLRAGDGNRFPNPTSGDYFMVVVEDADGSAEIMKCTSRNVDLLSVVRAQEGTVKDSFPVGARVENRLTAGTLAGLVYQGEAKFSGSLSMTGENDEIRSNFFTSLSEVSGTRSYNRIAIPPDGSKPYIGRTADKEYILTRSDLPLGVIMLWNGYSSNIPENWRLCDGKTYNGIVSPDLRGLFVQGAIATGDEVPGSTAHHKKLERGVATGAIAPHNHGGKTRDTALALEDIPGHRHSYQKANSTVEGGGSSLPGLGPKLYAFRAPVPASLNAGPMDPFVGFMVVGGEIVSEAGTVTSSPAFTTYAGGKGTTDPKPADPHSHIIDPDGGGAGVSIPDVSPANYSLCYIIKVA